MIINRIKENYNAEKEYCKEVSYSELSDERLMKRFSLKKTDLQYLANFYIIREQYKNGMPYNVFNDVYYNFSIENKLFVDDKDINVILSKLITFIYFKVINSRAQKYLFNNKFINLGIPNYLSGEYKHIVFLLGKKLKTVNSAYELCDRLLDIFAILINDNVNNELVDIIKELNKFETIGGKTLFANSNFTVQKKTITVNDKKIGKKETFVKKNITWSNTELKDKFASLMESMLKKYALYEFVSDKIDIDFPMLKLSTKKSFVNPRDISTFLTIYFDAVNINPDTKNIFQYGPRKEDMFSDNVQTKIEIRHYYENGKLVKSEQFDAPISYMNPTSRKVSGLLRMNEERAKSPSNMNLYYTMNESMKVSNFIQKDGYGYEQIVEKRCEELMQKFNVLYVDIDLETNEKGEYRSYEALERAKYRELANIDKLKLFMNVNRTMHGFHLALALSEDVVLDTWKKLENGLLKYLEKNLIKGIDWKVKDGSRIVRVTGSIQTEAPQDFPFDERCNVQILPVRMSQVKYSADFLFDLFKKEGIIGSSEKVNEVVEEYEEKYDKDLVIEGYKGTSKKVVKNAVKVSVNVPVKEEQDCSVFSLFSLESKLTTYNMNRELVYLYIEQDDEAYVNYYPEFTKIIECIKNSAKGNTCEVLNLAKHSINPCVVSGYREAGELITHINLFADFGLSMGNIHDVFRNNDTHPSANIYQAKDGKYFYKSFVLDIPVLNIISFVALILNVTYIKALKILCKEYGIKVVNVSTKNNELVTKIKDKLSDNRNKIINVFKEFQLYKEICLVEAMFDSVAFVYASIINHNEDYAENIYDTAFSFTWRYFMEYLNKYTKIKGTRSKIKTFLRMMEFFGILRKIDPEGMSDNRIQHLDYVFKGLDGKSFPSLYYLVDVNVEELTADMKELQGIVGEKLRFSKYDTHEKIRVTFPEKFANRVIINSNLWKNRTVSISKNSDSPNGFSYVSFENPFKGLKKEFTTISKEDMNKYIKELGLVNKNVYSEMNIYNATMSDKKVEDVIGKDENAFVAVNTLTYKEENGYKVKSTHSVNTIIVSVKGKYNEGKTEVLSRFNSSLIYSKNPSAYYLLFRFSKALTGKKAVGLEIYIRFLVKRALLNNAKVFKTSLSLRKSESMNAIPVPYTKQSHGEYETVVIKLAKVNNYYNYIIGNTQCYNFTDMRRIEKGFRKLATMKKDFTKEMYKSNKKPDKWDLFDNELLTELSSVCHSILFMSE